MLPIRAARKKRASVSAKQTSSMQLLFRRAILIASNEPASGLRIFTHYIRRKWQRPGMPKALVARQSAFTSFNEPLMLVNSVFRFGIDAVDHRNDRNAAIRPYSMALAPDWPFNVDVAGRTTLVSPAFSAPWSWGHLRSGTCGRVNSIAETLLQRAVLEHGKFGIKAFVTSDPASIACAPFQARRSKHLLMFTAP
jgi:hypothetical protein